MKMKKNTVLHPASRKAKKQISQKHHVAKVLRRKKCKNFKDELKRVKCEWFKNNLPCNAMSLSSAEVRDLISRYLKRLNAGSKSDQKEIENCSVSVSVDITNDFLNQEAEEYATSGLLVPDLTSKIGMEKLRTWNGQIEKLPAIPMTMVKRHVGKD